MQHVWGDLPPSFSPEQTPEEAPAEAHRPAVRLLSVSPSFSVKHSDRTNKLIMFPFGCGCCFFSLGLQL